MDLDDQIRRFFGTDDLAAISPAVLESGLEHMLVEFGLEKDRGRRFAMWALLVMLDAAPALDVAFKTAEDRDAARDFLDMIDRDMINRAGPEG